MIDKQLEQLFINYIKAFKVYDLNALQACYHLPCTLHTPDKIAYLNNETDFINEFIDIFTVLKHAKTQRIIVTAASYQTCYENTADVCIDWCFIDENGELFADFCAFYHLVKIEHEFKIVSVVSHELENSVALGQPLNIINTMEC